MAGGGVRGGRAFGSSDRLGEDSRKHPLTPADIAKTICFATGNHDLIARVSQACPYNLFDEALPISQLFSCGRCAAGEEILRCIVWVDSRFADSHLAGAGPVFVDNALCSFPYWDQK